eukprot:137541_1
MAISKQHHSCVREGYLDKASLLLKKFRKRWIVLNENKLYSYKTQTKNDKPTEIIDLMQFSFVKISDDDNERQFELLSPKSKRIFTASSTMDMNNWINSIKQSFLSHCISTNQAKSTSNPHPIIKIHVVVNNKQKYDKQFGCNFNMCISYSSTETMNNILSAINQHLNEQHHPIRLAVHEMSFINTNSEPKVNTPITHFSLHDIMQKTLQVQFKVKYEHQVMLNDINCIYMKKLNSNNTLFCPIYCAMKNKYEWNQNNLNHLNEFVHFKNEYQEKPECKYKDECKSYIRLETGGNEITDQCHMKLYRHPPRARNIKLSDNLNPLIIHKSQKQNYALYSPTHKDCKKYEYNKINGYLNALMVEVILNGYKSDLCLECGITDKCIHKQYSILQIVDQKMNHIRHISVESPLNRAEMLALILYTGCECNYALCASQRNGDYNKWQWFDYCLYHAIEKLSHRESGSFSVFSGLTKVKSDIKYINKGYFVTYVSTSWNKQVAVSFMKDDGMLIQIDKKLKEDYHTKCCDVSWISKFPDECEILFARSTDMSCQWDGFKCVVLDESNGVQTIGLSMKK